MVMKQVVRAAVSATVLLAAAVSAQAAVVQFRMTGFVTQSGVFDDGTTLAEGTPVRITYSYDTKQPSYEMLRNADGSGSAAYAFTSPYRFRLHAGDHRARVNGFHVEMFNDLVQPFGDTYEVVADGGVHIDGVHQPDAQFTVSMLSQAGNTEALRSLSLPKRLNEWSFDGYRGGRLGAGDGRTLLMFSIWHVRSTVCADVVPGTDECVAE